MVSQRDRGRAEETEETELKVQKRLDWGKFAVMIDG